MFIRVVDLRQGERSYRYLQLVESRREGGKVRQEVIANLGQLDQLIATGTLEQITTQLAVHCPGLILLRVPEEGGLQVDASRLWGPALAVEPLWRAGGWKAQYERLAAERGLPTLAAAAFALVLHRLLPTNGRRPDGDLVAGLRMEGADALLPAAFTQALDFLGAGRSEAGHNCWLVGEPLGGASESPLFRSWIPTSVEIRLVDRRADAISRVTRITCLWDVGVGLRGDGGPLLAKASLVGQRTRGRGPARWEEVVRQLPPQAECVELLRVGRWTPAVMKTLQKGRFRCVVGCRVRSAEQEWDTDSASANSGSAPEDVAGWRQVRWFDEDQAQEDRRHREAALQDLAEKQGRKLTPGMRQSPPFRRYGKMGLTQVEIDEEKVRQEEQLDGWYALHTNAELAERAAVEAFAHQLWAERIWQAAIPVSAERPVTDPRWEYRPQLGHLHACYLAHSLGVALKQKLKQVRLALPWGKILRDLSQVWAVEFMLDEANCVMRGPLKGCAKQVLEAAGATIPPQIQVFEQSPGG